MPLVARITTDRTAASKRPAIRSAAYHPRITPILSPPTNSILNRKPACSCGGTCPKCRNELGLQAKLKIGAPNDKYEQEADRVADQVMRMPEPGIQRQPLEEEEEEEEELQTKPLNQPLIQRQTDLKGDEEEDPIQAKAAPGHAPKVGATTHAKIQSLKGGGQPLPPNQRIFFESRMGRDFSSVRIHNDSKASDTARAINAKAFTVGRDVVFGAGQHQPQTTEGKRLLAHELVHVGQQPCGPSVLHMKPGDGKGKGRRPRILRRLSRQNAIRVSAMGERMRLFYLIADIPRLFKEKEELEKRIRREFPGDRGRWDERAVELRKNLLRKYGFHKDIHLGTEQEEIDRYQAELDRLYSDKLSGPSWMPVWMSPEDFDKR